MSVTAAGRTWDDASSPGAARLARRFEAAWREPGHPRPDPAQFLPEDPEERSGALLALLRTDLGLRWETGERILVEFYCDRYPGLLAGQVLVALLYEEFCLREEAGEKVEATEYDARFPDSAPQLRRILDIHGLVGGGSGQTTAFDIPIPSNVKFPEAGQTIAGFRLVEELGRGSFARVFRAEERQLADRPVALKVAVTGSREPQTLARLQHTHIVPVHSYRTDQLTSLHLLCMPYFGKVTLSQILADPALKGARAGSVIVDVLERLEPTRVARPPGRAPAGRAALGRRSFARAIAWWGARLAEALQHAHDRGVLHRDVKPSNVLVTGDGMPMLLDFNLAQGPRLDNAAEPAAMGGTLAYMAPEHLEAVADGAGDRVDGRADIYALGVVLFEALAGARPFSAPARARSAGEVLLRAAEERKAGAPSVRKARGDVPPELDAVIRRCLAPEPADRYASPAELAIDLQAVADDGPLKYAREPEPSSSIRWLRRNRKRFAVAAPAVLALVVLGATISNARVARVRQEAKVDDLIKEGRYAVAIGKHSGEMGQFLVAQKQFETAASLAEGRPELQDRWHEAREQRQQAIEALNIRKQTDALFDRAEDLRFTFLGFGGDLAEASEDLKGLLKPFYVFEHARWTGRAELTLLDQGRVARLPDEVNDLLFLWVFAMERSRGNEAVVARWAVKVCDVALTFAKSTGPWRALRARCAARLGEAPQEAEPAYPELEASPRACFQWGVLKTLEDPSGHDEGIGRAIDWLERATRLEPGDYWSQYYLAFCHYRAGHSDEALRHAHAAVALRPKSPWARRNRALLYLSQRAWDLAQDDLTRAMDLYREQEATRGLIFLAAQLDLGLMRQSLGDVQGARAIYDALIDSAPETWCARAARLNRAKLDVDAGALDRARGEYDALLEADATDSSEARIAQAAARLGRALLDLRLGRADRAEADLDQLLTDKPDDAEALALRAQARLALGNRPGAESDAARAAGLDPRPSHERLRVRTRLATGHLDGLRLDRPDDLAALPAGGPALADDLRAAADRLKGSSDPAALLTRAVLLSALKDHAEAEAEASRAVAKAPSSARALLVRARIRRRAGNRLRARDDVEEALLLEPEDPRLLEFRGMLKVESGRPVVALADLDRALARGAEPTARAPRARALAALGRDREAIDDWTRVLARDPEDARAYLGRARSFRRLGQWDQALADLENAAGWSDTRGDLLVPITLNYAACLPARPDRLQRILSLGWKVWTVAREP